MESIGDVIQKRLKNRNLGPAYEKLMKSVYDDSDVQAFLTANQAVLDKTSIERGEAKLYEFVNEKQKIAKGEPTFAPGYEPVLVVSNQLIDISYKQTKAFQAQQQASQMKQRVHSISMPKLVKQATFEKFDFDEESRVNALKKAIDFVDQYREHPDVFHPGLYLYGNFGVGKTYLLGAIANELAKFNITSTMLHFPSFAVEMRNSIGTAERTADKLNSIKQANILMLDDIGADSMSAWIRDDVLGVILEYRMQEELPTFFSSNFDMATFEKEHLAVTTKGDVEALKAKRIMERIRFLSREVTMAGDNRRPK